MSATVTTWVALTATQLPPPVVSYCSVPAVATVSILTAPNVSPVSMSLKPKLAALNTSGVSSLVVTGALAPVGASFAPLTVKATLRVGPSALATVKVSIAVWPAPRLCTAALETVYV